MSLIKFSIIVPVYNAEKYLDVCIESVLSQTYTEFELILIDDGSVDSSKVICDKWASIDQRVVLICQENAGAAAARNIGIDAATGDYIMFLDSDDWWYHTEVLQTIYARIKYTNPDVLSFNFSKSLNDRILPPYFSKQIASMSADCLNPYAYIFENHIWVSGAWNKVIRKSLFGEQKLYFQRGITSEDIDWSLRLAMVADKLDYIQDVLHIYRQHSLSVSHTGTLKKTECLLDNIHKCEVLIQPCQDLERKKWYLTYLSYQYGTLLFSVSGLKNKEIKHIRPSIEKCKYLLRHSKHQKIRGLYYLSSLFGINGVVQLLRIYRFIV